MCASGVRCAVSMRILVQGSQSAERLELLLQLTKIASEDVKDALRDHLVRGMSDALAAAANGIKQSNLKRALDSLERTAAIVEKIKEADWRHVRKLLAEQPAKE